MRAQREERRLFEALERSVTPLTQQQYRTLVRRLKDGSRYELGLEMLDEWKMAHSSDESREQIAAERIATLYAQRTNNQAVKEAKLFEERFPSSPLLPGVRLTVFRLAVRMGHTENARQTGLDLWEGRVSGATEQQRRSAGELLASYLVAVGEVPTGLELYRKLFRTSESPSDQRAYLWRSAVAALRIGQVERALTNLRGLIKRRPDGDLAPAALYWLGVAQLHADDNGAAKITFRSVSERFPYHYYGRRANQRLVRLTNGRETGFPDARQEFPELQISRSSLNKAEYKAAMTLARAGLTKDAAWYLRRLLDQQNNSDRGLALLAARASAQAGNYSSVSRILINHFGNFVRHPARGLPDDFMGLVYPKPFWAAIRGAADSTGIDPILLLSLMRQESRFDPEARSPVGALGLFQIMPYTAEALAQSANVEQILDGDLDEAALMQPPINAAIAATLTRNLLKVFDGAIAPVIASYNAGEEHVELWWAGAQNHTEDFFVDTIPYSETRRFVREVLSNVDAYRRIYKNQ